MKFKNISDINPDDISTWKGKIFLTFDIDWAADEVINDTLELISEAGIASTWFVTHKFPLISKMKTSNVLELGIHPNFNLLLSGGACNNLNATSIVSDLLTIIPEATSIRSHSTTQNSVLLDMFRKKGLTHDVNCFIPSQANIALKPWKLWDGLIRVPYDWEDDVHCLYNHNVSVSELANRCSLNVFDFHPIHVFLNTESIERYEKTRPIHNNPEELIKHRYEGYGTRSRLIELLALSDMT